MSVLLVTWDALATERSGDVDLLRFAAAADPGAADVPHLVLDRTLTSARAAAAVAAAATQTGADVIVLPAGHRGSEAGALLAHRLDAALVWDVATLRREGEGLVATKRVLGGTWDVTVSVATPAVVLATPAPGSGEPPATVPVAVPEIVEDAVGADVTVVAREVEERDEIALPGSAVVVAGGRGLEGDLTPVRELAAALGGAVGATRDIVEEGWIGHEAMVGQTGTMVAPRLYIGAGLSGAPHHVLGMRAAETIVAINLDPDAPIMEIADLAVVGDAAQILAEAARLVRERRGS